MSDTTFVVSPDVKPKGLLEKVDYVAELRTALRRPIEATWRPGNPLVACDEDHALLSAFRIAFYDHMPLRLSPDAVWVTLARGFALHVNQNAERLRHHFVGHRGKEKLTVERLDFLPGRDNPWPEVFEAGERLYPNPYLKDWEERLSIDDRQHWRQRWDDPQGVGLGAYPACLTSVPLEVFLGTREADLRLVGGLMGVTQEEGTLAVAPECGWAVVHEEPVDPLSPRYQWLEEQDRMREQEGG